MIRSMTGYGQASLDLAGARVTVELRSLNHRYADLRVRLPPELASREADLRRRVLSSVRRGRVDLAVTLEPGMGGGPRFQLNRPLVEELLAAARVLNEEFGVQGTADLPTLLSVPGLLRPAAGSSVWGEQELEAVERALEDALAALEVERRREGEHLRRELLQRMEAMAATVRRIRARAAEVPVLLRDRLTERLRALSRDVELDPVRTAQEAALLADRSDVTEEIVRLEGHLERATGLLRTPDGEPVGKRLDFLLQEVQRETNTINSKSADLDLSRDALELKAEIEKVREQTQNLE